MTAYHIQHPKKKLPERIVRELCNNWQLYLLVLPGVIYLLLFRYWPMAGVQIAFKDFKPILGIWRSPWGQRTRADQRAEALRAVPEQRLFDAHYRKHAGSERLQSAG